MVSKRGGRDLVMFTAAEMVRLHDTILTHNHPRAMAYPPGDPRAQGSSFSEDDVATAAAARVAEVRAVTPTWRFIMRRPPTGWDWDLWQTTIKPAYDRHQQGVRAEFQQAIVARTMTLAEAEARHYHEVWTLVARDLGLDYRREP